MPKPTPPGWPRISASIFYEDANAGIDFLCRAFGFEVKIKIDGDAGVVIHCELAWGADGLLMVSSSGKTPWARTPRAIGGGCTQSLMLYVDDVDAFCLRAKAAGATIAKEPTDVDYGAEYWADRGAEITDIEGHHWYVAQRLRG